MAKSMNATTQKTNRQKSATAKQSSKASPKIKAKSSRTSAKPIAKSTDQKSTNQDRPQAYFSNEDREQMVRYAAYHIAEKDGFQQGREHDYWIQAETQINDLFEGRTSDSAKAH